MSCEGKLIINYSKSINIPQETLPPKKETPKPVLKEYLPQIPKGFIFRSGTEETFWRLSRNYSHIFYIKETQVMVSPHTANQLWRGYQVDFKLINPQGLVMYVDLDGSSHLYLTKEKEIYFQERHETLSRYFGPRYLVLTTGENTLNTTLFDSFVSSIRDRFLEINNANTKEINDAKLLTERINDLPEVLKWCNI